jgi:predicted polyphosphate/ATP-dependent NAD kinase
MAKTGNDKLKKRAPRASSALLAPGVHPARIEMRAGVRFQVRTLDGLRVEARLAPEVEDAFAEECMREHRTVLVSPGGEGSAVLLGALQTSRGVLRDRHGLTRIDGKRIELEAEDGLVLRVGKSKILLDRQGTVKVVGRKMTMDVSDLVQVLSLLCKLP